MDPKGSIAGRVQFLQAKVDALDATEGFGSDADFFRALNGVWYLKTM